MIYCTRPDTALASRKFTISTGHFVCLASADLLAILCAIEATVRCSIDHLHTPEYGRIQASRWGESDQSKLTSEMSLEGVGCRPCFDVTFCSGRIYVLYSISTRTAPEMSLCACNPSIILTLSVDSLQSIAILRGTAVQSLLASARI